MTQSGCDIAVSVVIPVHNRTDLLDQTLQSLSEQSFADWEAIIVDDHSSDDARGCVDRWSSDDPRFVYLLNTSNSRGAPAARNHGYESASGEFVIFLDSDDILMPECLANRVAFMRSHPDVEMAVYRCELFHDKPGDSGMLWNVPSEIDPLDRFLRRDVPWQTTGPIWRRESVARIGRWADVVTWQDWELHIRALTQGVSCVETGEADYHWRMSRPGSISSGDARPERIRSFGALVTDVYKTLGKCDCLNESRIDAVRGLFVSFAREAAMIGRPDIAIYLWRCCYRTGLIGLIRFLAGATTFGLLSWRFSRPFGRRAFWRCLPDAWKLPRSTTLWNTPRSTTF